QVEANVLDVDGPVAGATQGFDRGGRGHGRRGRGLGGGHRLALGRSGARAATGLAPGRLIETGDQPGKEEEQGEGQAEQATHKGVSRRNSDHRPWTRRFRARGPRPIVVWVFPGFYHPTRYLRPKSYQEQCVRL